MNIMSQLWDAFQLKGGYTPPAPQPETNRLINDDLDYYETSDGDNLIHHTE